MEIALTIIVEDDNESVVTDSEAELPGYWDHFVVEDPREVALEVEQAEECEELRLRHDRIERGGGVNEEQLEATQQAQVDPVPGYSVPLDYEE